MRHLRRHLVGGLLGFGPLITLPLLYPDLIRSQCLAPYWWLLGPALWLGSGIAFACIRWLWRGRQRVEGDETRRQRNVRALLAGLSTLPVVVLLLLVAAPSVYHWDGGYTAARYTFLVVDPDGRLIPDAEFTVHGPTGKSVGWPVFDELQPADPVPPPPGFWPIFEYDGTPLLTDAHGRLAVHQAHGGFQFGGNGYTVFGMYFETSSGRPEHTLEFRRQGYRPRLLDFDDLNQKARERNEWPASVEIRVVLEPE